jgi:hypothetical protein
MTSAITNAASSQSATPELNPKSAQSKPQSAPTTTPPTDSVQLSKTAQAALAALKEVAETPAQTAKEAVAGDLQAKRLLAKETAAKQTR